MEGVETKPQVTITGVSGYLGSQVAKAFLEDGNFKVRGTVRDLENKNKIDPLRAGLGELFGQMELVKADLLDEASIIAACAGSTYVVHTASPFDFKMKEEKIINVARDGSLAVMNACTQAGVKRCVVTSSVAAITAMAEDSKQRPAAD